MSENYNIQLNINEWTSIKNILATYEIPVIFDKFYSQYNKCLLEHYGVSENE